MAWGFNEPSPRMIAEIDLLIDRGSERIGLEFKAGVATEATDWKHLLSAIDDGVIHRSLERGHRAE